jgi:hypothetical protein
VAQTHGTQKNAGLVVELRSALHGDGTQVPDQRGCAKTWGDVRNGLEQPTLCKREQLMASTTPTLI